MRRITLTAALAVAAVACPACGPRSKPAGPGTKPTADPAPAQRPQSVRPPAREVMIGEMCPSAAGGRPAVMPVFARKLAWISANDELAQPIRASGVRQFAVYAWAGGRAGVFSVAGSADVGLERPAAIGAYAGRSPCLAKPEGEAQPDPVCVEAQAHCGLAVAPLEAGGGFGARPYGEESDPLDLRTGGACLTDGSLVIDVDGDGQAEAFPAAQFLGPVRGPAEEVSAVAAPASACEGSFSVRHVLPPANPKHWRGLDLLGAIDIDGDGRLELVMSYHYSDRRTWAVYTARSTAGRLELAAESVPWPRP